MKACEHCKQQQQNEMWTKLDKYRDIRAKHNVDEHHNDFEHQKITL